MLRPEAIPTSRLLRGGLFALLAVMVFVSAAAAAIHPPSVTVTLHPSVPSPELLGTSVTWTAAIQGGQQGHGLHFQFSAAPQGQTQIVRDFDLPASFVWVPWTVEGTYTVTVVARDITSQPYTVYPPVSVQYVLQSDCHEQRAVRGQYHFASSGRALQRWTMHDWPLDSRSLPQQFLAGLQHNQRGAVFHEECQFSGSRHVAFDAVRNMHWEEFATNFLTSGPDLSFTTGHLPSNFPTTETFHVNIPATGHDALFPYVIFHLIQTQGEFTQFWPAATDLTGHVVWYHPARSVGQQVRSGRKLFRVVLHADERV